MNFDLIVIGSGPGGYVAAIRASQLGMKVGVVERESLGGICLNWGCIPTKALLKSAQVFDYIQHAGDYGITVDKATADFSGMISRSRGVADGMSKGINFLFRKNKITVIEGEGRLIRGKKVEVTDKEGKKTTYEAPHIMIATGGRAKELPNLPIDGKKIIEYHKAMSLDKQPKKMVVVGAGAIGVEFAYFYHTIGTEVTIVEFLEQGLVPREDAAAVSEQQPLGGQVPADGDQAVRAEALGVGELDGPGRRQERGLARLLRHHPRSFNRRSVVCWSSRSASSSTSMSPSGSGRK